jgi:hypothetical protein
MSFVVKLRDSVRRKIARWNLPDWLMVEIYLRLNERLANDPAQALVRVRQPFDGMMFHLSLVDPYHRLTQHDCYFHIMYSQDEETLDVVNFGYLRQTGL